MAAMSGRWRFRLTSCDGRSMAGSGWFREGGFDGRMAWFKRDGGARAVAAGEKIRESPDAAIVPRSILWSAAIMTPLARYIGRMRELCAAAPDRRTGRNARLPMADLGMAAFAVMFLQCPSFLSAQKHLESRRGRSNARTLFGIERIACDNHIRDMLDGTPPEHFDRMFHHVVNDLDGNGGLDFLRRLDGRLLIALDGTEYFTSYNLGCRNCSTRLRSNGKVENFHAMLGASIVAPGSNHLLPLPPEFIRPQDGDQKQDCEIKAAKRWLKRVGPAVEEFRPVYLGDDLYCCQPACEAVLEAGGSFLFTCKPKSHATLYEYIQGVEVDSLRTVEGKGRKKVHCLYRWMSGVPIRDGEDALKVNWFEITVASPSGGRRYHNAFATDLEVGRETVGELARCARARWKVENNAFGILKDSFNLEHNFGHGSDTLAGLLAMFNIISLLMQNACELRCEAWKAARARLAARYRLLDHIRTVIDYAVFQDWSALLRTIATADLPEKPP